MDFLFDIYEYFWYFVLKCCNGMFLYIYFLYNAVFNFKTIGAIAPTSKHVVDLVISKINFNDNITIVEYGAGLGTLSIEIIKKLNETSKLILFEVNDEFFHCLKRKFGSDSRVHVLNCSAENVCNELKKLNISQSEYIISSIPFSLIPIETVCNILKETKKIMFKKSLFITFQYSTYILKHLKKYFDNIDYAFELINIPPAHIYISSNLN